MEELLKRLPPNARRGSKPRCHILTHGTAEEVASRLTSLASPWVRISPANHWMPEGFETIHEAQLHKATRLLDDDICKRLGLWWLPPEQQDDRTPNFDIASTCLIENQPGLLLIEAKAHDVELRKEEEGRKVTKNKSDDRRTETVFEDRRASHGTIRQAMTDARNGLSDATALSWRIMLDTHYQMSNRFAWAWKVTECGLPVVLVYLGFLNATEMVDKGKPFASHEEWEASVLKHSASLFPAEVWNQRWTVNGVAFIPLIKSVEQPLNCTNST